MLDYQDFTTFVDYTCRVDSYYFAIPMDKCLAEQRENFDKLLQLGLSRAQLSNALYYGERRNYRRERVGMNFDLAYKRGMILAR